MKEYIGIGDKKVSIPEEVYSVLTKMDKKTGLIDYEGLDALNNSKDINVELINTQNIDGKQIKIYGLFFDNSENFEIVKVQ